MSLKNRQILNPYFSNTDTDLSGYKDGMLKAIDDISKYISEKEIDDFLSNKLQLFSNSFNEPQYLQAACELVICSHLANKYKDSFSYELGVNPPKNVDCAFKDNDVQFNLEIKCADYTKSKEIENQLGLKLNLFGRNPDRAEIFNDLSDAIEKSHGGLPLLEQQHMDNKLKDYLLSAQSKFYQAPKNDHLNILVVCCDSPMDIQKWVGYMFAHEGLFTNESFVDKTKYNLVDVVYITNLHHRHFEYTTKDKLTNHWLLENSFNLIFSNPFRTLAKQTAIEHFVEVMPNYSYELQNYQVSGDAEIGVKNAIRISHFVVEKLLSNGVYVFQPN